MGRPGEEHVKQWSDLHLTEPPGGFVGGWLRASAAVARPLARAGVSPNAVTIAALVFALAAVPLALIDGWIGPAAACAAVTVSGLLDALDGAVAVQAGRTTKVGFLLDSALDRLADAAYPAALALVAGPTDGLTALAVAAIAAAWYLEYV
ncbi:MAG: CDP-alcohol phosphatidyltransferase family protein, partial [Acidimicrobiales bacterium]